MVPLDWQFTTKVHINLVFLNEVCHNFSVAQAHVDIVIFIVVHTKMKFMTS